jgi:hypothetical protein
MHRIAKQSHFVQSEDQSRHTRPLLIVQPSISKINVTLPDRVGFLYPHAEGQGQATWREIEVHVLGENAHGVCFLSSAYDPNGAAEVFRMDWIEGPITRLDTGEQLLVYEWDRRVRRRFAMGCKTDALPLSTMLITAKNEDTRTPD